jgi:hypothetical protein
MTIPNSLRQATRAEKAMDKTREQSERDWRQSWWSTTDALSEVPATPREVLLEATNFVAETLGQSVSWVKQRRACGRHFRTLESAERVALIPRFAVASAAAKADPQTAAELILQAEHEGASLREFSAMLTGKSWTNAPENMTAQERLHVARTELKQRPHEVLADDAAREAAADADIDIRAAQGPKIHPDHIKNKLDQFDKSMADALGLDIPVQHLRTAKSEIQMAMMTRDIHGTDDDAFKNALAEVEKALDRAKADATTVKWTADDRRLAQEMGLNL